LEAGTSLQDLQQLLGHTDINTTMRYIHWLPSAYRPADLIAGLAGMQESRAFADL